MTKQKQTKPAQPPVESDSTAQAAPDERAEKERASKRAAITADLMVRPSFMSAHTSMSFVPDSMKKIGQANIVSMYKEVRDSVIKVVDGDMTHAEALLISQAMSLNSIYNECASLAGMNIATRLPQAEVLMRMALKAQAQCAQTLRVLGELKNPRAPATFVKQQNNAAGHQQVNNGATPETPARAHGEKEKPIQSNELLTEQHEQTLDFGATGGASRGDQALEAVGAVDRADQ